LTLIHLRTAALLAGCLLLAQCGGPADGGTPIALVDRFPEARKRSALPEPEAFSVYDVTIGGTTRRAIYARPPARMTWTIEIPDGARFRAHLGLREEGWDRPGDGVVFRVGISDGQTYTELLARQVNPNGVPGDRGWVPVDLDLSAHAGRTVDLILNTDHSLPGEPTSTAGDLAVWGEPGLVR
jgi:hypothetical protein